MDISKLVDVCKVADIECVVNDSYNKGSNNTVVRFSKQMWQSIRHYQENRNVKPEIAMHNIALGKKAEYMFSWVMKNKFDFPFVRPDAEVYGARRKSWDVDLPYRKHDSIIPNIHIKSCDSTTVDFVKDYSWCIQNRDSNGNFGRDELIDSPNSPDLVAFVYMNGYLKNKCVIKAVLPWKIVNKYLRDPKARKLIGIKKCIYYADLVANKTEIEREVRNIFLK